MKWLDEQIELTETLLPEFDIVHVKRDEQVRLLEALKAAREALGQNHQWHFDHDDCNSYGESDLYYVNQSAIDQIDAFGK